MESSFQSLEANTRRRAVERIKNLFVDAVQLEDISKIRKKYEADLRSVDQDLGNIQAAKLTNIGQAKYNVDSCAEGIQRLKGDFEELQNAIYDSRSLLKPYPKIRSASAARSNLNATLEHVHHFADVPVRIEKLRRMLQNDKLLLLEVWKETHRLILWRQSMKSQLNSWRDEHLINSPGPSKAERYLIEEFLEDKLSMIQAFFEDLNRHLLSCIGNSADLALEDSAKLVQAVEVIEAIERFQQCERRAVLLWARSRDFDDKDAIAYLKHANIRQRAITTLRDEVNGRARDIFQTSFVPRRTEAVDAGLSIVKATLDAADQMITDFELLVKEVAPCFPKSYRIQFVWRQAYEFYIENSVAQLYSERKVSEWETGDLLTINMWLREYNKKMVQLKAGKPNVDFQSGESLLLAEYLKRMEMQLEQWFKNIASTEQQRSADNSGKLFTSMPEMLFQVIYVQAGVVQDRLHGKYLQTVLLSILSKVAAEQDKQLQLLHSKVSAALCSGVDDNSVDIEGLVAEVNDFARLADKCDEFAASEIMEDDDHGVVQEAIDSLLSGYTSQAVTAALYIPTSILTSDLDEHFAQLFLPQWENEEINIAGTIIQTCTDWLTDLRIWIIDHFFPKVVREFFDQIIVRYVEGLLIHAHTVQMPFGDSFAASSRLKRDAKEIRAFFRGYIVDLEKAGIRPPYSSVQKRVEVLDWFADVLENSNGDQMCLAESAMKLIHYFQDKGVEVVTLVARLHPCGPRNEKDEKELMKKFEAAYLSWELNNLPSKGIGALSTSRFNLDFLDTAGFEFNCVARATRFLAPCSLRERKWAAE